MMTPRNSASFQSRDKVAFIESYYFNLCGGPKYIIFSTIAYFCSFAVHKYSTITGHTNPSFQCFSRLLVMKIINFQTFNLFLEILTHRYFCKLNLFLFIIAIIILKKMFDSDLSEANGRERQSCKCSYCPYIEHHLKKIPEILAPVN